jgi:lipid-A-disaccharide synthase
MPGLLISAGEASGDAHAARLMRAFCELPGAPALPSFGLGGDAMRALGFEAMHHAREMAVTGISEALAGLPRYRRAFEDLLDAAETRRPDAAVLVDYPDFNIRLGAELRGRFPSLPIVYYISPQVWAWRRSRVHDIASFATLVLTIFPFEEEIYRRAGAPVRYVGHPLVDEVAMGQGVSREIFLESLDLDPAVPAVALLPGSRVNEVRRILPLMLEAASLLLREGRPIQFVLSSAPTLPPGLVSGMAESLVRAGAPIAVSFDRLYNVLSSCQAAAVCSGTATVETGLMGVPMAVVYRVSPLSYFLARRIVRVPWISMVNILAQEEVVPELVQGRFTPEALAAELRELLWNSQRRSVMLQGLGKMKTALGGPGAARRAAEALREVMGSPHGAKGIIR